MASAQDLRKRIKSVSNTQQITKAMKMVASARLRKAQGRAEGLGPYTRQIMGMMHRISESMSGSNSPLLEKREVKRILFVIVGADKGLAGAFSSNLFKFAEADLHKHDKSELDIIASGRKVLDHYQARGYNIVSQYTGFSDKPEFVDARRIMKDAAHRFLDGSVDEVFIVYTKFINSMTQTPEIDRLLPVSKPDYEGAVPGVKALYDYVPSEEEVLNALLPQYLDNAVYNALLQSAASELGARMTAMTSATDNANELIDQLNLEYNKLRQAGITNEISEIVGGANALQ